MVKFKGWVFYKVTWKAMELPEQSHNVKHNLMQMGT